MGSVRSLRRVGRAQEEKCPRYPLQIAGEILGDHGGTRNLCHHMVCSYGSCSGLRRQLCHLRVVDNRRGAEGHLHLCLRPVGAGNSLRNLPDSSQDLLPDFIADRPDRSLQLRRIRNHIPGMSRRKPAHGQNPRIPPGTLSGDELLQSRYDVGSDGNRVHTLLRCRAVAADSLNAYEEPVAGSHHASRCGNHRPRRDLCAHDGTDVHAEHRIGTRFQSSLADGHFRPVHHLFPGLKQQTDGTAQLLPMLKDYLRCGQQHGRMGIMAAGVHPAFPLRRKRKSRLFRDGQGVHVCPKQQRLSRLSGINLRQNTAVFSDLTARNPQFFKTRFHISTGFRKNTSQLRNPVKVSAQLNDLLLHHSAFLNHCPSSPFCRESSPGFSPHLPPSASPGPPG